MQLNNPGPLVSVVFTSYNHKVFLRQALDSIINQTYANLEIIVVDDCSSDGSREILKTYSSDERVKLHLLEKNTGSYVKASNYGAGFAQGDYILFAQCDDYADPQQVAALMNRFKDHPTVGVVYSRSNMVDKSGNIIDTDFDGRLSDFKRKAAHDTLITKQEMRSFLSFSCVVPNLSAAIIKKEIYNNVGKLSDKYQVAADWAFWLAVSEVTDFYYLATPLNNFRQHDTTIRSSVKIEKQIIEIYRLFYEHISQFHLNGRAAKNMRYGAGFVWLTFLFEGPRAWMKSFIPVVRSTWKFQPFNIFYLGIGSMIFVKEMVLRKLINSPQKK